MNETNSEFARWFRSASPYIRLHRGKTFVIHIEDDAINAESFNELVHDLALLNSLEIRLVLIYSARHSIETRLKDNAIKLHYHKGIRITDAETLEIVKDAAGKLRIEFESGLSMGLGNTPMSEAEVVVTSGNFVRAKPLGIIDGVDHQFTGAVRSVQTQAINAKLDANEIVLIPPIGYSITGEAFNLEAKTLATEVAIALNADKLIFLMEAPALSAAKGKLINQLTRLEAAQLLKSPKGDVKRLQPCLELAVTACASRVQRVHLIDRSIEGAIVRELFSRDGVGTMISSTSYDALRQATVHDIPGILELIMPLEKQGVLIPRSREKLELEISNYSVMLRDDVIVGCASLFVFPKEKAAEVACLAIHPDYHNSGRGEQLLDMLVQNAKRAKVKRIFVLTTHTTHWFL
ncbi:MAG: amino-acid N-acetyltransferase, partial [Gammaproteobacteria bacterium]